MKNRPIRSFLTAGLIFLFAGIYYQGFSQSKSAQASSGSAVKLEYGYPSGKAISYLNTSKIIMTMNINGQSIQVNISSAFGCNLKGVEKQDKNTKLEIRIDTIGQSTESPMGFSGGEVKDIKGKTFNIFIAPTGKIIDIAEAQNFVYTIEGSGETDLSQNLDNYFPVLPSSAVKIGDTWNSLDSTISKTKTISMKMLINSVNKLEAVEMVNGVECARITSTLEGNMTMRGQYQGMDNLIKGPLTGTSEVLFAIKDGYFIRHGVKTKMNGNLEMSAPETMSFPVVMDINSVNEAKW